MEEIQQRKTKLQKDFEDNMRLLQEWEQSVTDFDNVVRASFIQEAKCLKQIEQHLGETAALLKVMKQSPSSLETATSEYAPSNKCCPTGVNLESGYDQTSVANFRESQLLSNDGCCDKSLGETSDLSDSISIQDEDADHSKVEDNCVEYCVAQDSYQYSVQSSPRLIPVREVPSEVYSSASGGSQESLTSETDFDSDGLSSQEQC